MTAMTNPADALASIQDALLEGAIVIQAGSIDPTLYVYKDNPAGILRLSYVKLKDKIVTAFAVFVWTEPINAIPCLQIGYAVPPKYRNRGRAKEIICAAVEELKAGLGRNGVREFYVEAIVGVDNGASNTVAKQILSENR